MDITITLPDGLGEQVQSKKNPSRFIIDALKEAIKRDELNQWQIDKINEGLEASKNGDFVPEQEMEQFFDKWSTTK